VLWDTLIYPYGQDGNGDQQYLIEVDAAEVSSFIKHLKRHKLRSKIATRDVQDEWNVWAVWQTKDEPPTSPPAEEEDIIHTLDPRLPALGARILLGRGSPANMRSYETLSETSLDEYTIRRYLHGIPEGQKEILRETALPMESNMDYLNGIDFRKGCYVGQELTIRTQHTGVIRKRILPVQLYASDSAIPDELSYSPAKQFNIDPGTDIKAQGAKRPAGRFLASVGNIGLALCRLENMTDLRVSAEGGTYKEGIEFSVASAGEGSANVKVKAFVPEWLRIREQEKVERRASRQHDPAVE
jgi:folate-binding protein YgfZ